MLLHINYLDCAIWGLVSWKAELPQKKGSSKEVVMKKRRGVRKRKVMILAGGNPLVVGKVPGDQGDGGSLPPVLLSHRIVASPSKSSMKVVGQKSYVQSHHTCYFLHAFLGQLGLHRAS